MAGREERHRRFGSRRERPRRRRRALRPRLQGRRDHGRRQARGLCGGASRRRSGRLGRLDRDRLSDLGADGRQGDPDGRQRRRRDPLPVAVRRLPGRRHAGPCGRRRRLGRAAVGYFEHALCGADGPRLARHARLHAPSAQHHPGTGTGQRSDGGPAIRRLRHRLLDAGPTGRRRHGRQRRHGRCGRSGADRGGPDHGGGLRQPDPGLVGRRPAGRGGEPEAGAQPDPVGDHRRDGRQCGPRFQPDRRLRPVRRRRLDERQQPGPLGRRPSGPVQDAGDRRGPADDHGRSGRHGRGPFRRQRLDRPLGRSPA
ncbi:hypothetical protein D3C80_1209200 [compost metagenome]